MTFIKDVISDIIKDPTQLTKSNKTTQTAGLIIAAISIITLTAGAFLNSGTLVGIAAPILFLDIAWLLFLVKRPSSTLKIVGLPAKENAG